MNRWKFSITILSCLCWKLIRSEDCTSKECIHASATMLERIDNAVDPCSDFYGFACGKFTDENYTSDESVAVDAFTKLKESIDTKVYKMLNNDEGTGTNLKLSKDLFKTCLERSHKLDVEILMQIIKDVGGLPLLQGSTWDESKSSMSDLVMRIRQTLGQGINETFDIASFIINLESANNASPRPSATFFLLRSAYFSYISNLLNFLGATGDAQEMEDELNHLLDFEYKLNLINHRQRQLSHPADIKQQSDEMLRNIFYFQWLDYFLPSQMKYIQNFENSEANSPSALGALLNQTSSRTLVNFVVIKMVDFIASQSRSELGAIYDRFQKQIRGRRDREQRWRECIDVLTENLPFAIGAAFVERNFDPEMKASFEEMYRNIKSEFASAISQAEWIDENTRDKLLSKVQSLVPLVAYPDRGFDEQAIKDFYDSIKIDKDQYFRTLFQLRIIAADDKFRQTYTSTTNKPGQWRKYLPPTTIASDYTASDNMIRFSAGIVQNLLFEGHKINYLGFGSTGFIIAHEISHIVNQIINDADSLSQNVQNEFTAKTHCLIEQYGQYREPELSENLNGKRTAIENMADNTGINLAYRAYRTWSEKYTGKRQTLIGLEYTWGQLFWLSAAQTWCGVYRREELIRKVAADSCATERFRVIGPIQNSPDFAKDFNCSQLSPMNRKNKCIIW